MIGSARTGSAHIAAPQGQPARSHAGRTDVPRIERLRGTVHVWLAHTERANGRLAGLKDLLVPEERGRANRYRRDPDRVRFIVGRAMLRSIVADYIDTDPRTLVFEEGEHGKPALRRGPEEPRVEFNVTHSGDWAMVAVAGDREVGIDVEMVRPLEDMDALAERLFTRSEVIALTALPPADRAAAFFRCWTRKEAVVKAVGTGLAAPLDRLEVGVAPGGPWTLRFTEDLAGDTEPWSLWSLEPAPGYAAAVAAAGTGLRLRCFAWPAAAR